MAIIQFYKVTVLPSPAQPNSLYFVKNGTAIRAYITDTAGTPFGIINVDAVVNLVNGLSGTVQLNLALTGGVLSLTGGTNTINLDTRYMKIGDTLGWTQVTTTPTTVAGYGITDTYTESQSDAITGLLVNLQTTNKTNLVASINELLTQVNNGMRTPQPIACNTNPNYPAATAGDTFKVTAAGLIGGAAGIAVQLNDTIICTATNGGGDQATVGASFYIVQANVDQATSAVIGLGRIGTQAEVTAGTEPSAWVTPATLAGLLTAKAYLQAETDPVWTAAKSAATVISGNWNFNNDVTLTGNVNGPLGFDYNKVLFEPTIGALIQTDIPSSSAGLGFVITMWGNSYAGLAPYDLKIQGYVFQNPESSINNFKAISNQSPADSITAFFYSGYLYIWFPPLLFGQQSNFKLFTYNTSSTAIAYNKIVSVTDAAIPASGVTGSVLAVTNILSTQAWSTLQNITNQGSITTNAITALKFITSGGTAAGFVKGDGSLDASTYLTAETDPVFVASPAHGITAANITTWNGLVSNVQADWNATTGLAVILNKPTIPAQFAPVAGAGISITGTYPALTIANTITNNNQLTNGAGFITAPAWAQTDW